MQGNRENKEVTKKRNALLWMEALERLMRRCAKRDPLQCSFYRRMYWGANHVANPMGFLR